MLDKILCYVGIFAELLKVYMHSMLIYVKVYMYVNCAFYLI